MDVGASDVDVNRYGVVMRRDAGGWVVAIVDPAGREVSSRACKDDADARTYASTVRQHVEWLSEPRFREYYRLPGSRSDRERGNGTPTADEET
jgi:hypothetical protein